MSLSITVWGRCLARAFVFIFFGSRSPAFFWLYIWLSTRRSISVSKKLRRQWIKCHELVLHCFLHFFFAFLMIGYRVFFSFFYPPFREGTVRWSRHGIRWVSITQITQTYIIVSCFKHYHYLPTFLHCIQIEWRYWHKNVIFLNLCYI